jgi:hypothetical protein
VTRRLKSMETIPWINNRQAFCLHERHVINAMESLTIERVHPNFLDLPGEIRNEIYILLLVIPRKTYIAPVFDCKPNPIHPQILSACREIHNEALQILYGLNTFIANPILISDLPKLTPFHPIVDSLEMVALIRKYYIRIQLDCDPWYSLETVRDAFTGVEELTVFVFQMNFESSPGALTRFEGVRGVKNVRIVGSTYGFPRYVEWLEGCITAAEGEDVEGFEGDERVGEDVRRFDI